MGLDATTDPDIQIAALPRKRNQVGVGGLRKIHRRKSLKKKKQKEEEPTSRSSSSSSPECQYLPAMRSSSKEVFIDLVSSDEETTEQKKTVAGAEASSLLSRPMLVAQSQGVRVRNSIAGQNGN